MFRNLVITAVLIAGVCGVAGAEPIDRDRDDPVCAQIAALIDESVSLALSPRVERAFTLTLQAANAAAHDGHYGTAVTLLRTFTFEVRGVTRAKRLQEHAALLLIARAEEAIGVLSR